MRQRLIYKDMEGGIEGHGTNVNMCALYMYYSGQVGDRIAFFYSPEYDITPSLFRAYFDVWSSYTPNIDLYSVRPGGLDICSAFRTLMDARGGIPSLSRDY